MKKILVLAVLVPAFVLSACNSALPAETTAPPQQETTAIPTESTLLPTESTAATQPETTAPPVPVVELTGEEQNLLLQLGMSERGSTGCTECMALVMRSVLNRIEVGHFQTIRGAIFAQDQYLPVSDGSFYSAQPDERCQEALEMVIYGWDESQGALFYEWCEGESWHSQNLNLLLQHCDTRFYN